MMADPGLMTDSTGDGMAGAMDVSFLTQQKLKKTYYNGSKPCFECGLLLNPAEALSQQYCSNCLHRRAVRNLNNRMAGPNVR